MTLRARLHRQLHIGSWPNGKLTGLNVFVVWVILAALLVGIVATEPAIRLPYQDEILIAEFIFGLVFLLEYAGRIFAAPEREGPGSPWQKRWRASRRLSLNLFQNEFSLAQRWRNWLKPRANPDNAKRISI